MFLHPLKYLHIDHLHPGQSILNLPGSPKGIQNTFILVICILYLCDLHFVICHLIISTLVIDTLVISTLVISTLVINNVVIYILVIYTLAIYTLVIYTLVIYPLFICTLSLNPSNLYLLHLDPGHLHPCNMHNGCLQFTPIFLILIFNNTWPHMRVSTALCNRGFISAVQENPHKVSLGWAEGVLSWFAVKRVRQTKGAKRVKNGQKDNNYTHEM